MIIFQIGEFSRLTQVSKRMLRYYDEHDLLKPSQKDPLTGYRLYAIEQIPLLNKIKALRDAGFLIQEIKILMTLKEKQFSAYFLKQEQVIRKEITHYQQQLEKLQHLQTAIDAQPVDMAYEVQLKTIPAYHVLALRSTIDDYFAEGLLWKKLFDRLEEVGLDLERAERFTIYHDTEEYMETNIDIEVVVVVPSTLEPIAELVSGEVTAQGKMASVLVYGPFERIAGAYHRLARWLYEHPHYMIDGKTRQLPINGPWNKVSSDDYLTEIQIPIKDLSNLR